MKQIKILGTGCPKCQKTTAVVKETVKETGLNASVQKVENIEDIMQYNILSTPAVVIDEKVIIAGRIPSKAELTAIFKQ